MGEQGASEADRREPATVPADRPRVVFLIGAPRSGTTWLQSLLGSHPDVVTPQETDLFSTFIAPLQTWWDEQIGRSDDEQRVRRAKGLPAVLSEADFTRLLAGIIESVLDAVRELDPAANVIVEKSPSHSRHTALIARYLPEATFVHIVRDGRDVVASLQAASRSWGSYWVPGDVKSAARTWRNGVTGAREAAATGRYTEVRYEQLRAGDPEPLQRAFAAAGLTVDRERCRALLEEYSLERMATGSATSPIALGGEMGRRYGAVDEPSGFIGRGEVGGWAESWSVDDRLLFDAVAGDVLVEFGYEPDHSWAASRATRRRYELRVGLERFVGKVGRRIGGRATRLLNRLP